MKALARMQAFPVRERPLLVLIGCDEYRELYK